MKKFRICEGDEIGQKTGEEAEKEEDAEQTARAKITCKKCMNKAQIERKKVQNEKTDYIGACARDVPESWRMRQERK